MAAMIMKYPRALLLVLALVALPVAAAPAPPEYEAGLRAYERGDYNEANSLWAKAARARHPASVYRRALMVRRCRPSRLMTASPSKQFRCRR